MSTEKEQKEALKKIEKLKDQAMELIHEAEKLADEAGVTFNFSVEYGMGGTYYPKKKEKPAEGTDEEEANEDDYTDSDEGWVSSSCW